MLTDHLGSTHVITDANGTKQQEMSFDLFGARRSATTWAREHHKIPQFTSNITLRGYTGHEQLDELSLVHMGGRIYDPILGRFLQADPFVQQPNNIQSFNRYSYVMNNPLNKTDPSGYIWTALAAYALKYVAANVATGMIATAINFALTAYQFYGEFQLYKGIVNAIDGGGTAMANFAGGFAKRYVRGMLEGAVIAGMDIAISNSEGDSSTNSSNTDFKGKDQSSAEDGKIVSDEDINLGRRKLTGSQKKEFISLLEKSKSEIQQFVEILNTGESNEDYKSIRGLYGAATDRQFAETKSFLLDMSAEAIGKIDNYIANSDNLLASLDVIGIKGRYFGTTDKGIGLNFSAEYSPSSKLSTTIHEVGHSVGLTHTKNESSIAFRSIARTAKNSGPYRSILHDTVMTNTFAFEAAVTKDF
jgi:RHS repeat-associated protein